MKSLFFALIGAFCLCSHLLAQEHSRPAFDPTYPDVHDPVMAVGEDGRYYLFTTGGGIGVLSSVDMKIWQRQKPVHREIAWAKDTVPGYMGCWAPDISHHGDRWYCYYSCSTFGRNGSAIGLATNRTLDPTSSDFCWEDQGPVIVSHRGRDCWNAIDPNLIVTPDGKPYLAFGSFWDGIQMIELSSADLRTPVSSPRTIARRIDHPMTLSDVPVTIENGRDTIEAGPNAIEAPFIIRRGDYYYLFVSFDYCCRGKNSTYKTVYGRSKSVEGPYLDREGQDMAYGGGTMLVGPTERYYGMGHNSAYDLGNDQWVFVCHAYDSEFGARSKLYIRPMSFTSDGWITLQP